MTKRASAPQGGGRRRWSLGTPFFAGDAGLVGLGGEVVAEVAQGVFEAAEDLVIGEIDEFVGEAFQDAVGRAAEGLEELLATFFTTFGGARSGRSGIV